jgi:F0F1-type ATP synthase assembly protein I
LKKNKNKKKKQHNKYLVLTSLSFQMGLTIYLGAYVGEFLDQKYNTDKNYYTIIFVLFSVFASLYRLIKQSDKLNNE